VVLRSNLARIQSQGQSAMPEGLEAGLRPPGDGRLAGIHRHRRTVTSAVPKVAGCAMRKKASDALFQN